MHNVLSDQDSDACEHQLTDSRSVSILCSVDSVKVKSGGGSDTAGNVTGAPMRAVYCSKIGMYSNLFSSSSVKMADVAI